MASGLSRAVKRAGNWVSGAVEETSQQGSAWGLYEEELLEILATALEGAHPKLCVKPDTELRGGKLLAPAYEEATSQLEEQSSHLDRTRFTVQSVARLAMLVNRAQKKWMMLGQRNLNSQLKQARAARAVERARAKKEAQEAKKLRAERVKERKAAHEAKKADKAEHAAAKKKSKLGVAQKPTEESESEEEEESSSGEQESSSGEEESGSESDEESDSESEDESSSSAESESESDTMSIASKTTQSSQSSASTVMALKPLKKLNPIKEAPGTVHARERNVRTTKHVNPYTGYQMSLHAEKRSFGPGWEKPIMEAMAEGLKESGLARKAAVQSLRAYDPNERRGEMSNLEGKLQAIGLGYAKRFEHFQRQPSLLEPPHVQLAVRERVLQGSAEEMLNILGITSVTPSDDEGSQPAAPDASPLRRLVEAQVKFVAQRAMWREAWKRSALKPGFRNERPEVSVGMVMNLLGEGVAAGLEALPDLGKKLAALSGSDLPPALRAAAWKAILVRDYPREHDRCAARLRQSPFSLGAAGFDTKGKSLQSRIPWHMLHRGLEALVEDKAERQEVEVRACALLLQAQECSIQGDMQTGLGSLAVIVALAIPPPAAPQNKKDKDKPWKDTTAGDIRKSPLDHQLEPEAAAILLMAGGVEVRRDQAKQKATGGIRAASRAVRNEADGLLAILTSRWPRLLKHLKSICSRIDLADVTNRAAGAQPPGSTLMRAVDEEWLVHGFVGSLPRHVVLWVWDQFALQGWQLAAEICACCLWLIRREVRRLDHAKAGATELKGAMRHQLHKDATLEELKALIASASAATLRKAGVSVRLSDTRPQVMNPMPIVG